MEQTTNNMLSLLQGLERLVSGDSCVEQVIVDPSAAVDVIRR